MRKIFVSSVVNGFEEYRRAAKLAIELMGDKPIMCENFGAKPYSSDIACLAEVESSDIYIVILGEKYGFVGPMGDSVTQMEYRAAESSGKPVLAFVQECHMEDQQRNFRQEVENFTSGFFRDTFRTPEDLKDAIVKSLRQLSQSQQAISEDEFKQKIDRAVIDVVGYSSSQEPTLGLAFFPQPARDVDIVSLEASLDSLFSRLCAGNILVMREGYKPEYKRDWTGLKTKDATVAFGADGMILFLLSPIVHRDDFFSGSFAPPSRIKELAAGAFSIIEATSCWAHISLSGMEHIIVRELPEEKLTSMTMRMHGDKEAAFKKLFIPITQNAYAAWIEQCLRRFERIFSV